MAKTTRDQVISDARDAVIEVSGDSSPITYGGETGLAARIRELTATSGTIDITYNGEYNVKEYNSANVHISLPSGTTTITENGIHNVRNFIYADVNIPQAKLDYVATFKVENENYYFASCQQGGYITAPVEPTITSGSFNGWKIGSTVVSFPYEPSEDVEIVADIVEPTPVSTTFTIDTTDPNNYEYLEAQRMIYGSLSSDYNLQIGDEWYYTKTLNSTTTEGTSIVSDPTGTGIPALGTELGMFVMNFNIATMSPSDETLWFDPVYEGEQGPEIPQYILTFTKVE